MTIDSQLFVTAPRRSGVAVWRQIADTLTAEIRDRRYADRGRLPSETELSARFAVNRHTLRQAIDALQTAGLVRVEKGRGTFVQHELLDYRLARRTRFSENLQRQGLLPGKQWLTAREETAPAPVARELGLTAAAQVYFVEALSDANGEPVNLMRAWYPVLRFPGLLDMLGDGTPTTTLLQRFGVADYVRASSRITTQLPSEETARLLKQPSVRPVLCVQSVDVDLEGMPIKCGETLFSGDRVQLVVSADEAFA